jgi:polysaccharide export outer membrane protein
MKSKLVGMFLCVLLLSSCHTSKQILYLQDAEMNKPLPVEKAADITIMPKDVISIAVTARDNELAMIYNLPRASARLGQQSSALSQQGEFLGYSVDSEGTIDFPELGALYVAGMTRKQLADMIKNRLNSEGMLKNPVVTVEFLNLKVNVVGEVARPGNISIGRDNMTLLEAISMAGDLTIYGKRDGVMVIREENGERTIYKLDLRSTDLFASPAYNLKQNDIVYVEPNNVRAGQSTVNENNLKSVSLWISLASFLLTLGVLFK